MELRESNGMKSVFGWPLAAQAGDIVMMSLIEFPGQWHMLAIRISPGETNLVCAACLFARFVERYCLVHSARRPSIKRRVP